MAGGADDEIALHQNTPAFDQYNLIPDALIDVSNIDTSVNVLGVDMKLPFYLSPSGGSGLFHPGKEVAVAKAAAKAGILYGLSTFSTQGIKEVGAATTGPKMFQSYIVKDREITKDHVAWSKEAGYDVLCLTVDSSIAGNRERDLKSGLSFPPKLKLSTLPDFAFHPGWALGFLTSGKFEMANISHRMDALGGGMNTFELAHHLMDTTVTWKDAEWLRKLWGGPFAIKGIQSVDDAKKAIKVGASAIIVSNHGGRQLDSSCPAIHRIAPIREAVGDKIEIIMDSGVRRGSHVIKALALGADAVSFARPYIYGLAVGGEAGVNRVIDLLKAEVERGMGLMGVTSVDQLTDKHIMQAPS
jgi:L-lactate dehydrogenase (cytochrome)